MCMHRLITSQGISTAPCSSYLFAAGQDQRIRAWSLRTGEQVLPVAQHEESSPRDSETVNLLRGTFPNPVTALRVTEGGGGGGAADNGMTVWAASGKRIYRFWAGQKMGDGVRGY